MNINSEKILFQKFLDKNEKRIFEGGKRFNINNKKNDTTLISIVTVVKNKILVVFNSLRRVCWVVHINAGA